MSLKSKSSVRSEQKCQHHHVNAIIMQLFSGTQNASETAECVIKKYKILKYVTHSFSVKFEVKKGGSFVS